MLNSVEYEINKGHAIAQKKRIEEEFTVVNGIIQNPGKFENEPITTVFYYELSQNSGGIYEDGMIEIEPTDREVFENIPSGKDYARVIEDKQGFVTVEFVNEPHSFYGWDEDDNQKGETECL